MRRPAPTRTPGAVRARPDSARPLARRAAAFLLLALAVLFAACEPAPRAKRKADFSAGLAQGRRYAERLAARQEEAAELSDAEVVAAGYLERGRLGLGSPFRLMEYALRDPRLPVPERATVAWALLGATAGGRSYVVDPRALEGFGTDPSTHSPAAGRLHLERIERAVASGDPRLGELAVREAYRLAAAEHAVRRHAPAVATAAAALARDRELARRDARRLLAHAEATGRHPFPLLAEWRSGLRFEVEAPPGAPRPPGMEAAAAARAVALAEEIRAARVPSGAVEAESGAGRGFVLGRSAARRLAALARERAEAPQAPVAVTVQRYEEELRTAARDHRFRAARVERLLERARTEESFAAEHALADTAGALRPVLARVALETALALRPHAQEKVWHPGFPAPTAADLERRFGLRSVRFDRDVPVAWRPYYTHVLAEALGDLEEVLPSLDLRGAAFRFGKTGREGVALAIHDPHGRVVHLPPESGVGAIAHEIGHDLDWQVARDRYGTRAAYGTELAVRRGLRDGFASAVRRMPPPPEVPLKGGADAQRRYAQRPPEIFARTFDGYVAALLAARGRSRGYLSTAQDEAIAGHGIALAPGSRDAADGDAFAALLSVASPLPEATRHELVRRWGPGRVPGPLETAGRVLAEGALPALPALRSGRALTMAGVMARGAAVRAEAAEVERLRARVLAEWEARACAGALAVPGADGEAAVRRAVGAAAEARLRGVLLRHAREAGFAAVPPWLREAWLGGGSEPGFDAPTDAPEALGHPLLRPSERPARCGVKS